MRWIAAVAFAAIVVVAVLLRGGGGTRREPAREPPAVAPEPVGDEIAALIETLEGRDAEARFDAAARLVQKGAAAIPELVRTLDSSNPSAVRLATWALVKLNAVEAVPRLLEMYGDSETQDDALRQALESLADSRALSILVKSLDHEDEWVAAIAGMLIGRLGPKARQAVSALVRGLHSDSLLSESAAWALAKVHGAAAVPELIRALGDEDPSEALLRGVGRAVSRVLGAEGKPAVKLLLPYASRLEVRDAIVAVGPDAAPILFEALSGSHGKRAASLLGMLGEIGFEQLRKAAQHPDAGVRTHSVRGLALVAKSNPAAVSEIGRLAADRDPQVARAALYALVDAGAKAAPFVIEALGRDAVREAALVAYFEADLNEPEAFDRLVPLIEDMDLNLQWVAVMAVAKAGERAIPVFRSALAGGDVNFRLTVIRQLWRSGPAAVPLLEEYRGDPVLGPAAAQSLAKIRKHQSPSLAWFLHDKTQEQRERALDLSRERRISEASLVRLMSNRDPKLRLDAACALAERGSQRDAVISVLVELLESVETIVTLRRIAASLETLACEDLLPLLERAVRSMRESTRNPPRYRARWDPGDERSRNLGSMLEIAVEGSERDSAAALGAMARYVAELKSDRRLQELRARGEAEAIAEYFTHADPWVRERAVAAFLGLEATPESVLPLAMRILRTTRHPKVWRAMVSFTGEAGLHAARWLQQLCDLRDAEDPNDWDDMELRYWRLDEAIAKIEQARLWPDK